MAWRPVDEDATRAAGRRFGVRLSPFVVGDVLAVRGVRMRNTRLTAVVSVIRDDVTGEWSASLAYATPEELTDDNEDMA